MYDIVMCIFQAIHRPGIRINVSKATRVCMHLREVHTVRTRHIKISLDRLTGAERTTVNRSE